ncbi:XrtA-associated tyrosine autokinase [Thiomonas bhubaneswarensis]|uniref:non-specific protein-tyrosine kinase n=1 Tax=Thiomonas bhubaneswarensis TaxID=339866 RepID=A0A0K6I634_9BURK|nr:XrtA-associated tyrosine autokinase [Thiomonas bhubaneswarensis]CUA98533.1 exopolysaccharide/PEP-CTERM locus tyrosine autokinase [Thiomonas bhubaneswarensis]
MSTIEQAVKRLEELRTAGVDVPWTPAPPTEATAPAPSPFVSGAPAASPAAAPSVHPLPPQPASPAARSAKPQDMGTRSKQVEIDLSRLAAQGYIVPHATRSLLVDEFRVIKRPLLGNITGAASTKIDRPNLIMVTSSLPGEGKTFVAANLAMSIAAELNHTVLLVDADPSRSTLLERLGIAPAQGLIDKLLHPELDLSDLILATNVPKLAVLPVGTPSAQATELFASATMDLLLEEMAHRYRDRVIILDAPPLLPSAEARALSLHAGQILFVVQAGRTHQGTVQQSLTMLQDHPMVYTLLNQSRGPKAGSPYGYYAY